MSYLLLIAFVSLLCLNSRGLGGPVTDRRGMLISDYLHELTISCSNSFLAREIAKTLDSCSVKPPSPDKPDSTSEKQLLCAMFFEINSNLCKSSFQEADFAGKYGQDVLIKDLCTESVSWTVTDIPWYPLYQTSLEGLFKDTFSCASLCHDSSKLHYANNVCKLYKIGYELMHETKPITDTAEQNGDKPPKNLKLSDSNDSEPPSVIHRDTMPTDILPRNAIDNVYLAQSSVANPPTEVKLQNEIKSDTATRKNTEDSKPSSQDKNGQEIVSDTPKIEHQEVSKKVATVRAKMNKDVGVGNVSPSVITTQKHEEVHSDNKPPPADTPDDGNNREPNIPQGSAENPENIDQDKKIDAISQGVQHGLDKNGVKQEEIDNFDELGGLDDNQMGNGEPPFVNHLENTNSAKQKTLTRDPDSARGSMEIPDSMQKVPFPSQPEFPSDDEDHFFSFFLTVIVFVALLYVLYHNKSKVTKVVMGLIVEGRQPGRRRNSRGHAYKRLDTLEQAMSASTTAPPSKIIY